MKQRNKVILFILLVVISILFCLYIIEKDRGIVLQENLTREQNKSIYYKKKHEIETQQKDKELEDKDNEIKALKEAFEATMKEAEQVILSLQDEVDELQAEIERAKKVEQEAIKQSLRVPVAFTKLEREMLYYIVQGEAGGDPVEHKRLIVQTIINRVKSSQFPDTIKEVLIQERQYPTLAVWQKKSKTPDQASIQAVNEVLFGLVEDKSNGAMYFYSPRYIKNEQAKQWFENDLQFCFEVFGHRFFK